MALTVRGGIALAQLIVYIPILFVSAILVARHGIKRRAGWIFLVIVSLLRIIGGAVHIVSEQQSTPNTTLITIFSILENAGLSPLMLATLGFLSTVGQGLFVGGDEHRASRGFRLLGVLSTVALVLSIVGGVKLGNAATQDDVNSGAMFRHIGVILFLVLYILVALLHGYFWSRKRDIMKYRRALLVGISTALPFLFVRTVYAVLSGFSPASVPGTPVPHTSLSKFSSSSGSWQIYLIMSVLPELVTVLTYLVVGINVPLQKDFNEAEGRGSTEGLRYGHELQPPLYS